MKTVIIAPRLSIGKLYGQQHGLIRPIIVTPRARDAVRGWAHVTRVVVLTAMIRHPALPELFAIVRPACEDFVELRLEPDAVLELEKVGDLYDEWVGSR